MERLDTKAFDDAITELGNIKSFFENTVSEMISTLDALNRNWQGEAGHKFDVYLTAFKARMSVDTSHVASLEEGLIAIRQVYLDTDKSLFDALKGE